MSKTFFCRDGKLLNQSNYDFNEIEDVIKTCYNGSHGKIKDLEKKISQVETNMKDLIAETKSSLEKKINDVEIDLNTRVINVQEQVSDLHTDVNNMKTSLGTFQDSTNEKFTLVWA